MTNPIFFYVVTVLFFIPNSSQRPDNTHCKPYNRYTLTGSEFTSDAIPVSPVFFRVLDFLPTFPNPVYQLRYLVPLHPRNAGS